MKLTPVCLFAHPSCISLSHLKARHKFVSHEQTNFRKATCESLWLLDETPAPLEQTSRQSHRGIQLRQNKAKHFSLNDPGTNCFIKGILVIARTSGQGCDSATPTTTSTPSMMRSDGEQSQENKSEPRASALGFSEHYSLCGHWTGSDLGKA